MQVANSLFIDSANSHAVAPDRTLSQIELPLGWRSMVADPLDLPLDPPENYEEHEG